MTQNGAYNLSLSDSLGPWEYIRCKPGYNTSSSPIALNARAVQISSTSLGLESKQVGLGSLRSKIYAHPGGF
jgi:hypothetical protein